MHCRRAVEDILFITYIRSTEHPCAHMKCLVLVHGVLHVTRTPYVGSRGGPRADPGRQQSPSRLGVGCGQKRPTGQGKRTRQGESKSQNQREMYIACLGVSRRTSSNSNDMHRTGCGTLPVGLVLCACITKSFDAETFRLTVVVLLLLLFIDVACIVTTAGPEMGLGTRLPCMATRRTVCAVDEYLG